MKINYEITPHVVSIVLITIGLLIFFSIIGHKIKHADPREKPKGLLLLVEMYVTLMDNFTINMVGEKVKSLAPYLGFLGIYLFTANSFGLLGFTPPTSSLSVTFSFGLTTFILIRYYGIKFTGKAHFTDLFKPILLTPINIIGELATPVSLSMRMFGNILSGTIIMTLIYTGLSIISPYVELAAGFTFIIPLLHIYFDLFSAFIQTLVFTLLSTVFIAKSV